MTGIPEAPFDDLTTARLRLFEGRRRSEDMPPMVLRVGHPGLATVLVVTSDRTRLHRLADTVAACGCIAVVALPSSLPAVWNTSVIDLVIVMRGVDDSELERVSSMKLPEQRAVTDIMLPHVDETPELIALLRAVADRLA